MEVAQPMNTQKKSKYLWDIYIHLTQYGREKWRLLLSLKLESFLHRFVFSKRCRNKKAEIKDTCGLLNGHFGCPKNTGLGEVLGIILDVIDQAQDRPYGDTSWMDKLQCYYFVFTNTLDLRYEK